jgi:hypothetical protein
MPMDITSTPFITYREINVDDTDVFEDAWGLKSEFSDVYSYLGKTDTGPDDCLVERLLQNILKRTGS